MCSCWFVLVHYMKFCVVILSSVLIHSWSLSHLVTTVLTIAANHVTDMFLLRDTEKDAIWGIFLVYWVFFHVSGLGREFFCAVLKECVISEISLLITKVLFFLVWLEIFLSHDLYWFFKFYWSERACTLFFRKFRKSRAYMGLEAIRVGFSNYFLVSIWIRVQFLWV